MKHSTGHSFVFALAISFFSIFSFAGVALSEEAASIKIQPSIIEEKADPGKDFNGKITATNTGAAAQTYAVSVKDIESIDGSGRPIFSKETEKTGFELSSWVKVENKTFTLAPGESVDIPFVIQFPKDTPPGGHFGAIFLDTGGKKPDTIGAAVGYEVGALLSFQVSGDVLEEANIRTFTSDKTVYGETKVKFLAKIENTGNSLIRPRGIVEIVDMFGKVTKSLELNNSGAAVFPHSSREFSVDWEDTSPHFGKYTAIASFSYGLDVKHTIFSEVGFWIAPVNIITPVFGFLFFVALILYISVKLYIRKKMKEYGITSKTAKAHSSEFSSRKTIMFLAFVGFAVVFFLALFAIMA